MQKNEPYENWNPPADYFTDSADRLRAEAVFGDVYW